jgi:hypothetical protein
MRPHQQSLLPDRPESAGVEKLLMTRSFLCRPALLNVLAAVTLAASILPESHGQAHDSPTADSSAIQTSLPAHLALQHSLNVIVDERAGVLASIAGNDLPRLRVQLTRIRQQLHDASRQMDEALLSGAWSQKEAKATAAQIIGRMQGIEILSLMGVATVSGYEYPTHAVPAAAADSTRKLFEGLGSLAADVASLNRRVQK